MEEVLPELMVALVAQVELLASARTQQHAQARLSLPSAVSVEPRVSMAQVVPVRVETSILPETQAAAEVMLPLPPPTIFQAVPVALLRAAAAAEWDHIMLPALLVLHSAAAAQAAA